LRKLLIDHGPRCDAVRDLIDCTASGPTIEASLFQAVLMYEAIAARS
jgi:hypothetical protein